MSRLDPRIDAAARLGVPITEVLAVEDAPAGLIYRMHDGTSLVDVPADRPDADGKTGLMFLVEPHPFYVVDKAGRTVPGHFPVYAQPGADDVDFDRVAELVAPVVGATAVPGDVNDPPAAVKRPNPTIKRGGTSRKRTPRK